jgi:hypothetical protein
MPTIRKKVTIRTMFLSNEKSGKNARFFFLA